MNIEIANRLVNLRKNNNLSQEALAEKIGISRQAVSKWERAEASPDTDNLIMLARLYGISIDELLKTDDEIPMPENSLDDGIPTPESGTDSEEEASDRKENSWQANPEINQEENVGENKEANPEGRKQEPEDYVHIGLGGVHVKDKDGSEVHVGWDGIHVDDKQRNENVHIDKNGVFVNGRKYDKEWWRYQNHFPVAIIICVLYLLLGVFFNAWHPGWLLFLLIPVWYSLVEAAARGNAHCFAYPVLVTLLYLCGGFFMGVWHPGWVIFITIPVYYSLVSWFRHERGQEEHEDYEDYNRG